jgi:hypothetical protein
MGRNGKNLKEKLLMDILHHIATFVTTHAGIRE